MFPALPLLVAELVSLYLIVPTLIVAGLLPKLPIVMLNIAGAGCYLVYRREGRSVGFRGNVRPAIRRFLFLAVPVAVLSYYLLEDRFLRFPRERPLLYLLVCVLYPILSVTAQEFLFRVWFFYRYKRLFPTEPALMTASALLFAYAHIVLGNSFALVITLIGGFVFSRTYVQQPGFAPVWVEHSLWGLLLFTLGWGRKLYLPAS